MCCTGFIPIASPTNGTVTVRLKNVTVSGTKTPYFVTYQNDKTYKQVTELGVTPLKDDGTGTLVGETNHTGWIRICCGVIDDTSILTIDEEITVNNFVTTSIDASGATFGYQNDKYVASSGNSVSAKTGYVATGFMELPRTFYVKGVEWVQDDTSCRMISYTEAFEKVGAIYGNNQHDGSNGLTLTRMDNGVLKFELKETNSGFKTGAYKYIRMSFKGTGANLIISDEELS